MQSKIFMFRATLALILCSSGWSSVMGATSDEIQKEPTPTGIAGWGPPMTSSRLEGYRGGFDLVNNDMTLTGSVANNSAVNVSTGSNSIADGSFNSASGFPTVIQNSGANVLIQNATIINVQFQ